METCSNHEVHTLPPKPKPRPQLRNRATSISCPEPALLDKLRESFTYNPRTGDLRRWDGRTAWIERDKRPVVTVLWKDLNDFPKPLILSARSIAWLLHCGRWPTYQVRAVDKEDPFNLCAVNLRTATGRGNNKLTTYLSDLKPCNA
jgi:hypothetical protein